MEYCQKFDLNLSMSKGSAERFNDNRNINKLIIIVMSNQWNISDIFRIMQRDIIDEIRR